jgi:hypothetical protein
MQNRAPTPRDERPPLPEFTPVPRQYRHDGWTPERQKAFIEALADTGSVSRAARTVNMAQANCYTLRRAPGAEAFRKAWDAALDFGVARLKDIAFERAIDGYQVPVFVGGKLAGYRRKTNDALLMFCLRHYGSDTQGRRTTINYFSTRAEAGAAADGAASAVAQAATTTVRTVISGDAGNAGGAARDGDAVRALEDFAGVALDRQAEAAIAAALAACAARRREADAAIARGGLHGAAAQLEDADASFARFGEADEPTWLTLDPVVEPVAPYAADEAPWKMIGEDMPGWIAQPPVLDHAAATPPPAPEPAPCLRRCGARPGGYEPSLPPCRRRASRRSPNSRARSRRPSG